MNSRFVETLVWLARLKSFSKTAEKLHATQPAIWNRIAKLEESLGVELYHHGAKEFELTSVGQRVLEKAEAFVNLADEIVNLARAGGDRVGAVRIGLVELVMASWLPDFIKLVETEFPLVSVRFVSETTPLLLKLLHDDEVDLAFVLGPVADPHIVNLPVGIFPANWIASPRHFPCADIRSAADLTALPLLDTRKTASGHDLIESYLKNYGVVAAAHSARMIMIEDVYSPYSGLMAVRAGLGVMAIPAIMCAEEIDQGQIAMLPVREELPSYHITACYKNPARLSVITELAVAAQRAATGYAATVDPKYFKI